MLINIYNKLLKIADMCMYTEIIMVWKKFKVKCNEHYLLKKPPVFLLCSLQYQITLFVFMVSFIVVYLSCVFSPKWLLFSGLFSPRFLFTLLQLQTVLRWLEFAQTQFEIGTGTLSNEHSYLKIVLNIIL